MHKIIPVYVSMMPRGIGWKTGPKIQFPNTDTSQSHHYAQEEQGVE